MRVDKGYMWRRALATTTRAPGRSLAGVAARAAPVDSIDVIALIFSVSYVLYLSCLSTFTYVLPFITVRPIF